MTDYESLKI